MANFKFHGGLDNEKGKNVSATPFPYEDYRYRHAIECMEEKGNCASDLDMVILRAPYSRTADY